MLVLEAGEHTRVDLIFGYLPYEKDAIHRARSVEIAGRQVRLCSPEDLIVLKVIAYRHMDEVDIRAIMKRQGDLLDRNAIESPLRHLPEVLAPPSLVERWEAMKAGRNASRALPLPREQWMDSHVF